MRMYSAFVPELLLLTSVRKRVESAIQHGVDMVQGKSAETR
jgi:hypothetical protein